MARKRKKKRSRKKYSCPHGYKVVVMEDGSRLCQCRQCVVPEEAPWPDPPKPKKKLLLPKSIKTKKDVRAFFDYILFVDGVAFHPDESFESIVAMGTGKRFYTKGQAELRDRLMEQAWQVADVYEEGVAAFERYQEGGHRGVPF